MPRNSFRVGASGTKATAERLLPHHRLVKAWPLGLKLQMLQTLVLSVTANVLPLLTSMCWQCCAFESKTVRLDQLRKKIALSGARHPPAARLDASGVRHRRGGSR